MATEQVLITDDNDDGFDNGSAWLIHRNNYAGSDEFTVRDTPSNHDEGGVRFLNVGVPQGATINTATLTLNIESTSGFAPSMTATGDNLDNAPAWSDTSRPQSGFTDTTAGTTNSSLPTSGTFTLDIKACVQDIADRAGWSSGNAMRFRIEMVDDYATWILSDFDISHSNEAILDIDYTAAAAGEPLSAFYTEPQRLVKSRHV